MSVEMEVRADVQALKEAVEILKESCPVKGTLERVNERLATLEAAVGVFKTLDERLSAVEVGHVNFAKAAEPILKKMETVGAAIDERFAVNERALNNVAGWMGDVQPLKPPRPIFSQLESLQRGLDNHTRTLDDLSKRAAMHIPPELESRIGQLERLLLGIGERLNTLTEIANNHDSRVKNLEGGAGRVVELANRVVALAWVPDAVRAIYREPTDRGYVFGMVSEMPRGFDPAWPETDDEPGPSVIVKFDSPVVLKNGDSIVLKSNGVEIKATVIGGGDASTLPVWDTDALATSVEDWMLARTGGQTMTIEDFVKDDKAPEDLRSMVCHVMNNHPNNMGKPGYKATLGRLVDYLKKCSDDREDDEEEEEEEEDETEGLDGRGVVELSRLRLARDIRNRCESKETDWKWDHTIETTVEVETDDDDEGDLQTRIQAYMDQPSRKGVKPLSFDATLKALVLNLESPV